MRIVGVNGIATDGSGSIDLLLDVLADRGFEVVDVRLPWRHALSARWGGCKDGLLVAQHAHDGDIVVGHSFGAYRAFAAHKDRDFAAVFCIAPACSDELEWRYPERVHCYHSSSDWIVWIGAKLMFHPFGNAGNTGFKQSGVRNYAVKSGHSDYFRGELLKRIADHVSSVAKQCQQKSKLRLAHDSDRGQS